MNADEERYDWEQLTSDVVCRFSMHPGKPLLPWPELPQNLAFLAHVIDAQRRERQEAEVVRDRALMTHAEQYAELQKLRGWLEAVSLGRATKETHAEIRSYLQETP